MEGLPATTVRVYFQDCNTAGPYVDAVVERPAVVRDREPDHPRRRGADHRHRRAARGGRDDHGPGHRRRRPSPRGDLRAGDDRDVRRGHRADELAGRLRDQCSTRPGAYRVQFVDCTDHPQFAGEWWNDQPTAASATPVTVAAGQVVGNVDAVARSRRHRHDLGAGRERAGRRDDAGVRHRLLAEPVRAVRRGERRRHVHGERRAIGHVRARLPRLRQRRRSEPGGPGPVVGDDELPGGLVERGPARLRPAGGPGRTRPDRAGRQPA